ncbi:CNT_collapsed_G0022190.mRNA.1.CDS.1 [Saccharomyces cerevisiae]|nr:CNT_collapsed_G0022190.mRNA.1.CDS.1 [Saccharomyces cerevisiae]
MLLPLPAPTLGQALLPLRASTSGLLPTLGTNATTTESDRPVLRRTALKMGMLRIIDSIQSPTLTNEPYIDGKGVKWFC